MSPRSILKRVPTTTHEPPFIPPTALPYPPEPHQVHFPPQPSLTQTYLTHSGAAYDRAPIVVVPNECQLPERGCPGRTYDGSLTARRHAAEVEGRLPHPRAAQYCERDITRCSRPPPLVPDVSSSSSESDESDGVAPPPFEYNPAIAVAAAPRLGLPSTHSTSPLQAELDKALLFLPYPPRPPLKDRESGRREKKRRSLSPKFKSEDCARSYAASSLEGCLGGF